MSPTPIRRCGYEGSRLLRQRAHGFLRSEGQRHEDGADPVPRHPGRNDPDGCHQRPSGAAAMKARGYFASARTASSDRKANDMKTARILFRAIQAETIRTDVTNAHPALRL